MRKSELIKKLNEITNDDLHVCVADWKMNLAGDSGDGSGTGMYSEFDVTTEENASEDAEQSHFIALSIDNNDYDNDGNNIKDKLIETLEKISTFEIDGEPKNYKDTLAVVRQIAADALDVVFPK